MNNITHINCYSCVAHQYHAVSLLQWVLHLHSLVFYARGKHFLIVDVDFCKRRASDSFLIDQWNRREEYRFENDGLAVGNAKT